MSILTYARSTGTPPVRCATCGDVFTGTDPAKADQFLRDHQAHPCSRFVASGGTRSHWCVVCGHKKYLHPTPAQATSGSPRPGGACTVAGPPPVPTVAGPGASPPGPA